MNAARRSRATRRKPSLFKSKCPIHSVEPVHSKTNRTHFSNNLTQVNTQFNIFFTLRASPPAHCEAARSLHHTTTHTTSHHTTLHHTTPHHTTPHHTTPHQIISHHHTTGHQNKTQTGRGRARVARRNYLTTSNHITSHHTTGHRNKPKNIQADAGPD